MSIVAYLKTYLVTLGIEINLSQIRISHSKREKVLRCERTFYYDYNGQ